MANRPYKCPLCPNVFRKESGMNWHIAHRHETPEAMEALNKNYQGKMSVLQEDNSRKAQEIDSLNTNLNFTKTKVLFESVKVIQEQTKNLDLAVKNRKLTEEYNTLVWAFSIREFILQDRYGIKLRSPFGEPDTNSETPSQPGETDQ